MRRTVSMLTVLAAGLILAAFIPLAEAKSLHRSARGHVVRHVSHKGHVHKGFSRRGPPYGYGFGFATYAGDPFATDDYFDGYRCHYLHHRDVCLGLNRPLDPFE